jgi:hypothetical protein
MCSTTSASTAWPPKRARSTRLEPGKTRGCKALDERCLSVVSSSIHRTGKTVPELVRRTPNGEPLTNTSPNTRFPALSDAGPSSPPDVETVDTVATRIVAKSHAVRSAQQQPKTTSSIGEWSLTGGQVIVWWPTPRNHAGDPAAAATKGLRLITSRLLRLGLAKPCLQVACCRISASILFRAFSNTRCCPSDLGYDWRNFVTPSFLHQTS